MAHSTDRQSSEHLLPKNFTLKSKKHHRCDNKGAQYSFVIDNSDQLLHNLGFSLEPSLLIQALTHRSFAHENPGLPNNERLEFLGDSVLEFVVTETLYAKYPEWPEGRLAKMRAKAVSEGALAHVARTKLQLGSFVLLGHGESTGNGSDKDSILCDTVESLIGAVFLEHGISGARLMIHHLLDDTLNEVAQEGPALDWKTALVVLSHQLKIKEPQYVMEADDNLTSPTFTAHVIIPQLNGTHNELTSAQGPSKRKAQLAAAKNAYRILSKDMTIDKRADEFVAQEH